MMFIYGELVTTEEIEQRRVFEERKKRRKKDEAHRQKINSETAFIVPIKERDYVAEMEERKLSIPEPIAPMTLVNMSILLELSILTEYNTSTAGVTPQWVNLSKDKKWLDKICTDRERLGTDINLRVKIDLPNSPHTFTIEKLYKPYKGSYSTIETQSFTETSDNENYIYIKSFRVGSDGNEEYSFRARSDGNIANSSNLITWRKFYVHHFFEKSVVGRESFKDGWSTVASEYRKHNIWISGIAGYENQISEFKFGENLDLNRSDSNENEFNNAVAEVYTKKDLKKYEPYIIPITYVNRIDETESIIIFKNVKIEDKMNIFIDANEKLEDHLELGSINYLNLDDGIFPVVSATIEWDDEEYETQSYKINNIECRLKNGGSFIKSNEWNGEDIVGFMVNYEEIKGLKIIDGYEYSINITYNIFKQERKGIAPEDNNMVVIRVKENDYPTEAIIHELGHKCGLVANGKSDSDYKQSEGLPIGEHQYQDNGSHCGYEMDNTDHTEENRKKAQCVMFGLVYTGNSKFCPSCIDTLHKSNFRIGWSNNFTNTGKPND